MGRFVNENEQLSLPQVSYGVSDPFGVGDKTSEVFDASDLLVAYIADIGVEFVFGIPGGAIEPLYNALARSEREGGPEAVVARHEAGAAFMADGYSRNSGNLGVCCATTGPGATNLITGVASAYENSIPLLVITAQTALTNFGRKAFQESTDTGVNTVGMFQFCTSYNTMVSHVEQLEQKLVSAVMTATNSSKPAHLSIPLDILRCPIPAKKPSYNLAQLIRSPHLQDDAAVHELCRQLEQASNIVFVLGSACHEAIAVILRAAFKLKALIVSTPDGKGLISPHHPLYRGVIGFAGHESAEQALLDPGVDTVVAVGTTLGEWSSNGWDVNAVLNTRLIHIEPLESNLTNSPMARLHVRGRVLSIFETLLQRLDVVESSQSDEPSRKELENLRWQARGTAPWHSKDGEGQLKRRKGWEDALVDPPWLMSHLTRLFTPGTRFLADTGSSIAWAVHYLHPFDRRVLERRNTDRDEEGGESRVIDRRSASSGLFQTALEFSSMGWAIGASVGAALACPGQSVVCITGDGSMLMSGQEITVALQRRLSVIFVVLNDSALGMVRHGQRIAGAEEIGCELPGVDFCAMARAMGVRSYRITCPRDLMKLGIEDLRHEGPTLLDIRVDPEAVPPIGVRMKVLQDSAG